MKRKNVNTDKQIVELNERKKMKIIVIPKSIS